MQSRHAHWGGGGLFSFLSVISKAFDAIKTMVECLQRSSVDYPPHVITSALRCAQNIVFSRVLLSPSAAVCPFDRDFSMRSVSSSFFFSFIFCSRWWMVPLVVGLFLSALTVSCIHVFLPPAPLLPADGLFHETSNLLPL